MRSDDLPHGRSRLVKSTEGRPTDHDTLLDRFNATPEEKEDLITVLHQIMENFVDRSFGVDPVQHATAVNAARPSTNPTSSPRGRRRPRSSARRRRAPHTIRAANPSKHRRTRPCSRIPRS